MSFGIYAQRRVLCLIERKLRNYLKVTLVNFFCSICKYGCLIYQIFNNKFTFVTTGADTVNSLNTAIVIEELAINSLSKFSSRCSWAKLHLVTPDYSGKGLSITGRIRN